MCYPNLILLCGLGHFCHIPGTVAGLGESSLRPLHCSVVDVVILCVVDVAILCVVDVAEGCIDFKVPQ